MQVRCSKNTIYLALKKREEGCLGDKPHTPKSPHSRKTKGKIIEVILSRRAETGFGKRRLRWYVWVRDGLLIPESTIGKILRDAGVVRSKSRVRRESRSPQYRWDGVQCRSGERLAENRRELLASSGRRAQGHQKRPS
ncbi:hypothetical protein KAX06_00675, partial [candidate division WOR-3 bacterium]|nr:hypothetical protein [candidate division WOR-3 bacterium]